MAFNIEEYISRRVREMLDQNWTDHDIIQQLVAVVGRKKVVAEIARQRNREHDPSLAIAITGFKESR